MQSLGSPGLGAVSGLSLRVPLGQEAGGFAWKHPAPILRIALGFFYFIYKYL